MKKITVSLVAWDWYKTLSSNHLYQQIAEDHPAAYETIQSYFLQNSKQMEAWKRGELAYQELHNEFASLTGLTKSVFDDAILVLAKQFDIDQDFITHLDRIKQAGIEQVIVTDNYDIWDEFFLPEYSQHATKYFSMIQNSHKFRISKPQASSHLIEELTQQRLLSPAQVLFIDDNREVGDKLRKKGYQVITHHAKADLLEQLEQLDFNRG